jgi:hypothetical protein
MALWRVRGCWLIGTLFTVHCEGTLHAFFKCPRVVEIWENLDLSRLFFIYDTLVNLNGIGLRELVKMSCWYMWWERRKIIHEEHVLRPARSAQAIQSLTLNYDRALKKMQE